MRTVRIDICLSYRSKKYVEGETEKAVWFGIEEGLKRTGWTSSVTSFEDAVDYQTHSTAITFNLTVPHNVTDRQIRKELSFQGLSVNIEEE